MTVAVYLSAADTQAESFSTQNNFLILAERFPEHHFIFIFDKPASASFSSYTNITPVVETPQIKNRLLQHYFFNYKIPRLLNKYNANVFVCSGVCSLRTNIPQCLILKDLLFLQNNTSLSRGDVSYLKRYARLFFRKAGRILVPNTHLKELLHNKYAVSTEKMAIVATGIDVCFKEGNHFTAEETRKQLTEGKNYFICLATPACEKNLICILKGFSVFKKWQKSEMQLVILFQASAAGTIAGFDTYKHRDEVKLVATQSPVQLQRIIAGAYAAIYLPAVELTETIPLNALALGIPLLVKNSAFYKTFYGNAAYYADEEGKDISEKMMLLYKDEHARNDLINRGKDFSLKHNVEQAAADLWQSIQTASVQ